MTDDRNWFEEGRKHFVASVLKPERPPQNYPTQDTHTAEDEAEYVRGFNHAKAAYDRGGGFDGLDAYVRELTEQRAEGNQNGNEAVTS